MEAAEGVLYTTVCMANCMYECMYECTKSPCILSSFQIHLCIFVCVCYLANCVSIPGQDGLKIDDLTRHSQFLLSHAGNFSHHVHLKKRTPLNFRINVIWR